MTQDGLINNIINTCGIYGFNPSNTQTALQYPLGTDAMKNPTQDHYQWKYSSGIIILMSVKSNSYPDTVFSVHQCVRFTPNPKNSHKKEVLVNKGL